jgi:hypothetical protein
MKIELTRNNDNKIVGYKLLREDTDDSNVIECVRDMLFYGMDDSVLIYDGRNTDDNSNTIELRWATKAHVKEERKKILERT